MVGLIAVKKQQAVPNASPKVCVHAANPVIPAPTHREFLGQEVKGIGPVLPCFIDIPGKPPVRHGYHIGIICFIRFASIISMQKDAFAVRFHLICAVVRLKGKYIIFDYNCHRLTAFLH